MSWPTMLREGRAMRHGRDLTWAQVLMAANTPMLLRAGLVQGRTDAGVLASGQVVGLLHDLPSCAELITGVVGQGVEILARLALPVAVEHP
jgi:NAD(P)H-dependent flavin oxidoreductase YrpB (nitropropane dioxygenase family)